MLLSGQKKTERAGPQLFRLNIHLCTPHVSAGRAVNAPPRAGRPAQMDKPAWTKV
jgi:hypothetical protein